ncbi:MAG: hypothetical protein IKB70_08400 [Bacilli bacterium]|nr:hypothetical protein [Bacilli bacterium]
MLDRVIIRKYEIGFERIFGLLGERILKMGKRGFVTEYALQIEGNRFKLTKEQYEFLKERENRYVASRIYENNGYENFLEYCQEVNLPIEFIDKYEPCESEGEYYCSLFCPHMRYCKGGRVAQ